MVSCASVLTFANTGNINSSYISHFAMSVICRGWNRASGQMDDLAGHKELNQERVARPICVPMHVRSSVQIYWKCGISGLELIDHPTMPGWNGCISGQYTCINMI